MNQLNTVQLIAVWLIPVLFAITLHEAAHGFVAYKLGDDTAFNAGRVTINPFKHIDLIGTIIVPILLVISTGLVFGWAKPVPVNPRQLFHPKRDIAWVALAGPASNFIMALLWGLLFKGVIFLHPKGDVGMGMVYLVYTCQAGIMINLLLVALNILPIPPLDGSRLVTSLLPKPWDALYNRISQYGFLILLLLTVLGVLSKIMLPIVAILQKFLFTLLSFPLVN